MIIFVYLHVMKNLTKMILCGSAALMMAGCDAPNTESTTSDFKYTIDSFADLKVMRYRIPGWENLSLQQKAYAYHLAEATPWRPFWKIVRSTHKRLNIRTSLYMPSAYSSPTASTIITQRTRFSPHVQRNTSPPSWTPAASRTTASWTLSTTLPYGRSAAPRKPPETW